MAAGLLAVAGHRVVFLGPDTPVDDIVAATAQAQARDVVVSVSFSVPSPHGGISALRAALPARVRLYVGGAGSEDIEGVVRVPRLSRLAEMMNT
jgi:methylmalonyl-CoA mutase cobalamin-binding subunit